MNKHSGFIELTETLKKDEVLDEPLEPIVQSKSYYDYVWSDFSSLIYLFILYTIQGVPMGLSASIPFILQDHISYTDLATFSLASLPFSLKILWAPIVDSLYISSIGRRKSWLVPSQLICALIMYLGGQSWAVSQWLGPASHEKVKSDTVNILALTVFFGILYFLMATQDIAVDGWSLTLLKPQNRHLGSICNTLGQTFGFSLSNVGFLALLNPNLCNRWLRKVPSDLPMITLAKFLQFWAVIIIIATFFAVFFSENSPDYRNIDNQSYITEENIYVLSAYSLLLKIVSLRPVIELTLILLTCRVAFAPADVVLQLKLVEAGISKEEIALYGPLIIPASILCPILLNRRLSEKRQLDWFLNAYKLRLGIMVIWIYLLYQVQRMKIDKNQSLPFWLHCIIFTVFLIYTVTSDAMFFSQMAFFSSVADQVVGGTYMTLLNTIANLGNKWSHTLSLMTLGFCESIGFIDGLILQMLISTVIGVLWLYYIRETIQNLKFTHPNKWLVTTKTN